MNNTVAFTPITVTAETLQILAKEENYLVLLGLYMAYVEITIWQHGNNIFATNDFMMKRLKIGEIKLQTAKKRLVELGLIHPTVRRNPETGEIISHNILIKHVIAHNPSEQGSGEGKAHNPDSLGSGFHHALGSEGTNPNDHKINPNDYNLNPNDTNSVEDQKNFDTSLKGGEILIEVADVHETAKHKKYDEEAMSKIKAVYDYYCETYHKNPKQFKLDEKRKKSINARLENFKVDELTQAIYNASIDPFYSGQNDRGWAADLDFIVRNDANTEKLMNRKVKKVVEYKERVV